MIRATRKGRWTPSAIYELFPRLAERKKISATQLSGGEQQMLAIGRALLLNEQNLGVATSVAERQLVMVSGQIAAETTADALRDDPDAQRRYLGVESASAH